MRRTALRRGAGPPAAVALAALAARLCGAPPHAEAYVRYKTTTNAGFFWPQTCVPVSAFPPASPTRTATWR